LHEQSEPKQNKIGGSIYIVRDATNEAVLGVAPSRISSYILSIFHGFEDKFSAISVSPSGRVIVIEENVSDASPDYSTIILVRTPRGFCPVKLDLSYAWDFVTRGYPPAPEVIQIADDAVVVELPDGIKRRYVIPKKHDAQ
jgi:hypothetical protein